MELFDVVKTVDQVEFFPLGCGEGAEDGVVEKFAALAEFLLAAGDEVIHFGDLWTDFRQHFLRRQAARTGYGRSFPSRRQVAESDDDQSAPALRPGLGGRGQRLASFGNAFEALQSSRVSEIQMFEDLGGTPFSRGMSAELLGRKSCDRRCDSRLQFLKMRVHAGLLTFSVLSVRMLRNHNSAK
jgi:hypothetical protein